MKSDLPDGEHDHGVALQNLADEILAAGGPADMPRDHVNEEHTVKAPSVTTVIVAEVESAKITESSEQHGETTVADTGS